MKEQPPPERDGLRVDVHNFPVEEAVPRLIEHAVDLAASDLYFGTNENHVSVSVRHLGVLRLISVLPLDFGRRCMAHLKAVAGMDVAERRRPLDGRRIYRRTNGHQVDLRINTIPTLYGEDFTLRILERDSRLLHLDQLGLLRHDYNRLLGLLQSPSGLILVTGPTGAGKTTTLYACLNYLNSGERKINTIEDPIEYAVAGVRQSQVHPKIDVDFPDLLRSVLRQAPDVIMVGEIRDPVTAETAVRAANSGHLVLATLHAPVAAGAVQSMLSLGVHPHFLASSLLGAIAQRLLRTLCPTCRIAFEMGDVSETFEEVRKWLSPDEGKILYGQGGCDACRTTGYAARTGVFEVLVVSKAIRKLIMAKSSLQTIRQKAIEDGTIEFRQAALLKVAKGETTVEEVFRVVPTEYLGVED
ncbi:MAG: type II/IV secretion system protein [Gemmataceae bacterium]|nr:type II/IV secretion system protein [Gemmataceae bacterium]